MARFDEDTLMRNAQFIIDQVTNMDAAVRRDNSADDEEELLITTPAMRSIIRLSGATPGGKRCLSTLAQDSPVNFIFLTHF